MTKTSFGTLANNTETSLYTLVNKNGMELAVTDYGATIVAIRVKDKAGKLVDVALGYDNVAQYVSENCYFGATVGRYANRISDAKIVIDGETYQLEVNDNENNLHSGSKGTADLVWDVTFASDEKITLEIVSKDLEQGFPGNCKMVVTYVLTDENAVEIHYEAVSDKKTLINPTNHSYFNLNGQAAGTVLNHDLCIKASKFTPVQNGHSIPTGELAEVKNTPFDFTSMKKVGRDIEETNDQLTYGTGYDHNWVIDKETDGVELIAELVGDETGIKMSVYTDLPGVQLYTGNFIAGQHGKDGAVYEKRGGLCLETQYFPNSANEPKFERPIFDANEKFESTTIYAFS